MGCGVILLESVMVGLIRPIRQNIRMAIQKHFRRYAEVQKCRRRFGRRLSKLRNNFRPKSPPFFRQIGRAHV